MRSMAFRTAFLVLMKSRTPARHPYGIPRPARDSETGRAGNPLWYDTLAGCQSLRLPGKACAGGGLQEVLTRTAKAGRAAIFPTDLGC